MKNNLLITKNTILFAFFFLLTSSVFAQSSPKKATSSTSKNHTSSKKVTKAKPKLKPKPVATPRIDDEFTEKGEGSTGSLRFKNTHHNFGKIKDGDIFDYDFEFVNTGTKAINILDARASCGCTVPIYPFIPIEPGEKGVITVHYNSKTKAGQQHPLVTVITDAPSKFQLHLEGYVDTDLIPMTKN